MLFVSHMEDPDDPYVEAHWFIVRRGDVLIEEGPEGLRIPLRRDALSEGDETVLVTLDGLVNAKWGGEKTAVLTIHDSAQYVLFLPVVRGD